MNSLSSSALTLLLLSIAACSSSSPPADRAADGDAGVLVIANHDAGASNDGQDAAPPAEVDAGGSDDAEIAIDAGPSCNDLAPAAPAVNYSLSDEGSPAAATGGPIVDGTYYLTGYTIYGAGSVGAGFTANQATSVTLVVAGASWTEVQVYLIENTTSTVSTNLTVATSAAAITLTPSCPAGAATDGTFTATASALQLVTNTSGFVVSETFVKQ